MFFFYLFYLSNFFMVVRSQLPTAENYLSLSICILVHVCLLRGEMPVCKAIHLSASLLHSGYHQGKLPAEGA